MALSEDLERILAAAEPFAAPAERLAGILAAEPLELGRVYLCAYEQGKARSWLGFDHAGRPIDSRRAVRAAASLAALCEIAEETAGGGDLDDLRARLAELRATETPAGIEAAEDAAAALAAALEPSPRLATTAYLDA
ncbi:MAG: hypothetical protein ACYDCH_01960, partial [Gaiellaceae bacterium]